MTSVRKTRPSSCTGTAPSGASTPIRRSSARSTPQAGRSPRPTVGGDGGAKRVPPLTRRAAAPGHVAAGLLWPMPGAKYVQKKLSTFLAGSIALLRVAVLPASWLGCGSSPSLPPKHPLLGLGEGPSPETLTRTSSAGAWSIRGTYFTAALPDGLDVLLFCQACPTTTRAESQHDQHGLILIELSDGYI